MCRRRVVKYGNVAKIPMEELAEEAGCTLNTLRRNLDELREHEFIRRVNEDRWIVNPAKVRGPFEKPEDVAKAWAIWNSPEWTPGRKPARRPKPPPKPSESLPPEQLAEIQKRFEQMEK